MCKQFPPSIDLLYDRVIPQEEEEERSFHTGAAADGEKRETGKFGARVSISLKTSTARRFLSCHTTFMQCSCLLALMKAPASLNRDSTAALLTTQNAR